MTDSVHYIALTFDDGPSEYTEPVLDILARYGIKATFFCVGKQAKAYPHLIRNLSNSGHVIGNHTWDHPHFIDLTTIELRRQIRKTNEMIESLTGQKPTLFRPPYGEIDLSTFAVIRKKCLTNVLWTVECRDWELQNTTPIHERLLPRIPDDASSIVLLHDGDKHGSGPRDGVIQSLPIIIETLLAKDFRFVTMPEFHKVAFKKEQW